MRTGEWQKHLHFHGDGSMRVCAVFIRKNGESWGWVSKHYLEQNQLEGLKVFEQIKGTATKSTRFKEDWECDVDGETDRENDSTAY